MMAKEVEIADSINITNLVCDRWVKAGEGNRAAIYYGNRIICFQELYSMVNRFARVFLDLGIGGGDRVVVRAPVSPQSIAAILALMKIGAVSVPLSTLLGIKEIRHILSDCRPVAYCGISGYFPPPEIVQKAGVLHQISLEESGREEGLLNLIAAGSGMVHEDLQAYPSSMGEPAFILYSTGTTGLPKGIVHGHQFILGIGETMGVRWLNLKLGDVVLHPHEISFSYAWSAGLFAPFYCGVPIVIYTEKISPKGILECLEKFKVTVFCSVPTVYRMLLSFPEKYNYRLSSLQRCISAGEPLSREVSVSWQKEFGVAICDGIGTTESFLFCAQDEPIVHGSMGKPLPGYEVAIFDENGQVCPPGKVGQLAIKENNPSLFISYLNLPDKWDQSHQNGWFFPGDYAYQDQNGYYWHVSRSDDIIKSRGYLISPREVEEVLLTHPLVRGAGVIGVADPILGQIVKAFIVLSPELDKSLNTAREIREWVRERVALFKVPKEIQFIDELPFTTSGKILRRNLRDFEITNSYSF